MEGIGPLILLCIAIFSATLIAPHNRWKNAAKKTFESGSRDPKIYLQNELHKQSINRMTATFIVVATLVLGILIFPHC